MKDNFSEQAKEYSQFRPGYPEEAFQFIKSKLTSFENAWDCGTGNGQVAARLSEFFKRVEATDISRNQLKNAKKKTNISYSLQPAEKTDFREKEFDLIISAQAAHWFDLEKFYNEVRRCLKPNGILVLMGYELFYSNKQINEIINEFYDGIIGPFWDPERRHLENSYQDFAFPFSEIETPEFVQEYLWSIDHLLGYLRTWSAVKHYENHHKKDPVFLIEERLRKSFGERGEVYFPIFMRMGKLS